MLLTSTSIQTTQVINKYYICVRGNDLLV